MTQVYDDKKSLIPVTVIEAGPCPVIQVKTTPVDGYDALQIGFQPAKAKHLSKAELGHLKKHNVNPLRTIQEIRCEHPPKLKAGDVMTVAEFRPGQEVDVIGTVKGRGFQGVMKRFDFQGGPDAHGSMFHRRGGSYGMRQTPGHIFKNKRMPGHMGDRRRTVQNLTIVQVLADKNLILVKGSVPGANGSPILIRSAKKAAIKAANQKKS